MRKPKSFCPVKQKRALLKSNPPRDNWIEGDEIKPVSTFGEANTSPKETVRHFILEPSHALKNLGRGAEKPRAVRNKTDGKKYLSFFSHAAFHAEPVLFENAAVQTEGSFYQYYLSHGGGH
jgi:hypothetical protein